jgi:LPS-assembly protein
MYLYVPYRNQDDLPVFDTTLADLNLVQLFRTNRYVGGDRLSDANQVTLGVTSRLLDAKNGRQFLTATIGQSYFFDEPRVRLPGETADDQSSSDVITELGVSAFRNWNVGIGAQWDTSTSRFEKGDVNFQYVPEKDRVFNLGYRFRRDTVEQIDTSLALPVSNNWSGYARFVYSFQDNKTLEYFGGVEYRSCCYRLRMVARNYVRNRSGDTDSSILLQLELNGLSNVGVGADKFLERSIRGYSATPSTR